MFNARGVLFATVFRQLERSLAPFIAEADPPRLPPGWSDGPRGSVYENWPLSDVLSFEENGKGGGTAMAATAKGEERGGLEQSLMT